MNIEEKIATMSLEEKLAQMIVVRGIGYEERIRDMLREGKIASIGAVAIPERTVDEATTHMNRYLADAKNPLIFYIDAEWGVAQVFPDGTRFPAQMAVGASRSEELAYQNGYVIASECKALGFSIVGSPVLDININYKNPIISTRAFSDDTDLVIKLGRAYVQGIQDAGVIPCGKHYPGHGDTAVDSHMSMPIVTRDRDSLMDIELRPYKELAKEMWGVMTAHIAYPALAEKGEETLPATLSRKIIHGILREEFGYDGLIISDSLTMKGIKDTYGLEAAVGAIHAGHDIILQDYDSDPKLTMDVLVRAVHEGKISVQQIDESVTRILKFKQKIDALGNKPIDTEHAKQVLGCEKHRDIARKVAEAGVTLLENECMPLHPNTAGKTLVISTVGEEEGKKIRDFGLADDSSSKRIAQAVAKRMEIDHMCVPEHPSEQDIEEVLARAEGCEHVIFASFIRPVAYKPTSGTITENQQKLIRELTERAPNFIYLIFGNPYCLLALPKIKNCIVGYGDDQFSIEAATKVVFGELEAQGVLPVRVGDLYPFGYSFKKS